MVDIKPRIKIKHSREKDGQHPDARMFCITTEISHSSCQGFLKPFQADMELDNKLKEIGGIGCLLLEEVFAIAGIEAVYISPYTLTIWKNSAFDWDEIEPDITAALKRTFGPRAEEAEIIRVGGDESPERKKDIRKTSL